MATSMIISITINLIFERNQLLNRLTKILFTLINTRIWRYAIIRNRNWIILFVLFSH